MSPMETPWSLLSTTSGNLPYQFQIEEFITDTTNKLRPKNEIGGILELFKYDIKNIGYGEFRRKSYSANLYKTIPSTHADFKEDVRVVGPVAVMETDDLSSILAKERVDATQAFESNAYAMLSRCTPTSKQFGLARSIGELKDFRHLGKLSTYTEGLKRRALEIKDLPDLYLTVQFGVAPLISDIKALLVLPGKVSKKLNYLLKRSMKPTSYRTKFQLDSSYDNPPSFSFPTFGTPYDDTIGTTASRKRELRMAVNSTFEFPPVELPQLRQDLKAQLYGADLDLKTIYDLIPWTWMIDWFTGFGDYLSVIEQINTDPSLINYGFITYHSEGNILTQRSYKKDTTISITQHEPNSSSYEKIANTFHMNGNLTYEYQKRISLGDLGVSTVDHGLNLSPFQSLIIGALSAQRYKP